MLKCLRHLSKGPYHLCSHTLIVRGLPEYPPVGVEASPVAVQHGEQARTRRPFSSPGLAEGEAAVLRGAGR